MAGNRVMIRLVTGSRPCICTELDHPDRHDVERHLAALTAEPGG